MNLKSKFAGLFCALALMAFVLATPAKAQDKDIVDTAVAAGSFNTLAKALQAAGLIDTLKSNGPFTVFAPTDEAFAKLPQGTVEALLADIPTLKKVLLYHVVGGKSLPASEVVKLNGKAAKTAEGSAVMIKVAGDKVMVDKANVVKTDVNARNGIIHVIDTVIIPKGVKIKSTRM